MSEPKILIAFFSRSGNNYVGGGIAAWAAARSSALRKHGIIDSAAGEI